MQVLAVRLRQEEGREGLLMVAEAEVGAGFELGNEVLHDFEIKTVKRMEDGRVYAVSDGHYETSGCQLAVVPSTERNRDISEDFRLSYQSLRKLCPMLDFSRIRAFYVNLWLLAVEDPSQEQAAYQRVVNFERAAVLVYRTELEGIRLFRD